MVAARMHTITATILSVMYYVYNPRSIKDVIHFPYRSGRLHFEIEHESALISYSQLYKGMPHPFTYLHNEANVMFTQWCKGDKVSVYTCLRI